MSQEKRSEKSYYQTIQDWMEKQGYFTKQTKGIKEIGKVDVVGVKLRGTEYYTEPEIMSVEVKEAVGSLGRKAAQAKRYSLFSHYPYIAVRFKEESNGFDLRAKEIAREIGVGLLEIREDIREVLSPPRYSPPLGNVYKIIRKIGLVRCTICGLLVEKKEKAHRKEYETIFRQNKKVKIYFCKDCCESLANLLPDYLSD